MQNRNEICFQDLILIIEYFEYYLCMNAVNSNQYDEFPDNEISDNEISGFAFTTKFLTTKVVATKFPPLGKSIQ